MTTKKRNRKLRKQTIQENFRKVRVLDDVIVEPVLYHSSVHGTYVTGAIHGDLCVDSDNKPMLYFEIGEEVEMNNPVVGTYKPIKPTDNF